ncbi:ATP-binding cassette domain-containing protein, partial [Brevibacillus laterosporus]
MIEFEHVSKTIDTKCILKDITFTLPKGKIVGLLGPNGAGKTTLLKIAAQITSDYKGCVKLNEDAMFLP